MRLFATSLLLAGCAKAGTAEQLAIDAPPPRDGGVVDTVPSDAPPSIDAPVMVTMAQTNTAAITNNNSLACHNTNGYTSQNSYYRVFTLADYGVSGAFYVTQVSFGVDLASAGPGTQPAQVKIGTYAGAVGAATLDLSKITPINSANVSIPNGDDTMFNAPITATIPAGKTMIVELAIPDGQGQNFAFYVGTNTSGETKPGYTMATACGNNVPTKMATIAAQNGLPEPDLLLTVTGTH